MFDGTSYLRLTFFNQPYRANIAEGTEISVFGKVDLYRGRRQMVNPALDVLGSAGEQTHRRAAARVRRSRARRT